jgi:uncharacterized protein (DUF58 family)
LSETAVTLAGEAYARARKLRLRVLRRVRTRLAGAYASAFRGPGIEFAEFMRYQPGDDVRHIDWQVTARRREAYVRRHVEERELRLLLAMDVSRSMGPASRRDSPRWAACEVAASLALAAALNADRAGGIFFASDVLSTVRPARGERHALSLVRECITAGGGTELTDLRPLLSQLLNLRGHSLVVLLSDLATTPPVWAGEVRGALAGCARKHDLAVVWTRPASPTADLGGVVVETVDPESGRPARLDMFAAAGRRRREHMASEQRRTHDALRGCSVPTLELLPGEDGLLKLLRLLRRRAARCPR